LRQRSCRVPEPGTDATGCQPGGRRNMTFIRLQWKILQMGN